MENTIVFLSGSQDICIFVIYHYDNCVYADKVPQFSIQSLPCANDTGSGVSVLSYLSDLLLRYKLYSSIMLILFNRKNRDIQTYNFYISS